MVYVVEEVEAIECTTGRVSRVSRTLDGLLFARLRTRTTATIVSEFL